MLEWLGKREDYLEHMLEMEAPPSEMRCSICPNGSVDDLWRCNDCVDRAPLCAACLRTQHTATPLHRVERWKKNHFSPSWLWKVGIFIDLCRNASCNASDCHTAEAQTPAGDDMETESGDWTNNDDFTFGAKPPGRSFEGGRVMTVVHTNGVHYLPFHFCTCEGCESEDMQLFCRGFYPSTFKHPRTVFTFGLLDDYSMEILECFTSTYHYYAKLRRLTNRAFPRAVPVSSEQAWTGLLLIASFRIAPENFDELAVSGVISKRESGSAVLILVKPLAKVKWRTSVQRVLNLG
jgi:CxC2 like cysteine cluster associated with KDZ transposases